MTFEPYKPFDNGPAKKPVPKPIKKSTLDIPLSEISFEAIRSQGAGGQNVNKVASAIHLRFDVGCSSLPQLHPLCDPRKLERTRSGWLTKSSGC